MNRKNKNRKMLVMKVRWAAAVCVIAATVASAVAAGSAFGLPQGLYTALLTTSYRDSELPSGFFTAKVSLSKPQSPAKSHHVVGEVEVDVNGPDPTDAILYAVFPSGHDATADLVFAKPKDGGRLIGKVPAYKIPSALFAGTLSGKNAFGQSVKNGITAAAVVKGSVLVAAITTSSDNPDSGNVPAALALLRSGLRHLSRVEASVLRRR
jgi:hypothetical protein